MSVHQASTCEAKAAKVRRGFYIHLAVYLAVNALLSGLNLATGPDRLWCPWPLFGWGIGVLAHAVVAFTLPGKRASTPTP